MTNIPSRRSTGSRAASRASPAGSQTLVPLSARSVLVANTRPVLPHAPIVKPEHLPQELARPSAWLAVLAGFQARGLSLALNAVLASTRLALILVPTAPPAKNPSQAKLSVMSAQAATSPRLARSRARSARPASMWAARTRVATVLPAPPTTPPVPLRPTIAMRAKMALLRMRAPRTARRSPTTRQTAILSVPPQATAGSAIGTTPAAISARLRAWRNSSLTRVIATASVL